MYFTANQKVINVTGFGLLPSVFPEYINIWEKRSDLCKENIPDHFYFLAK